LAIFSPPWFCFLVWQSYFNKLAQTIFFSKRENYLIIILMGG
jgi:hypothetical protein